VSSGKARRPLQDFCTYFPGRIWFERFPFLHLFGQLGRDGDKNVNFLIWIFDHKKSFFINSIVDDGRRI
jgi:hypothetical protein